MGAWTVETDAGGIAWLVFDKPGTSTNVLSRDTLLELDKHLAALESSPPRGLVIQSAKSSGFIAGADVKEFVSSTRARIRVEALPGYAPDLNPWDEGGWHHLKDVEMRNLVCRDLDELHQELDLAVGRLRQKPHLVRSFFAQAGLKLKGT